MGRRQVKEFRAPETLALIDADRAEQPLVCPYCQDTTIERTPARSGGPSDQPVGRVSLTCRKCRRNATYLERTPVVASNPFAL